MTHLTEEQKDRILREIMAEIPRPTNPTYFEEVYFGHGRKDRYPGLEALLPTDDPPLIPLSEPPTFKECATCSAKPGSPTLCPSCIHNRTTIERLTPTDPAVSLQSDFDEMLKNTQENTKGIGFGPSFWAPDPDTAPPLPKQRQKTAVIPPLTIAIIAAASLLIIYDLYKRVNQWPK